MKFNTLRKKHPRFIYEDFNYKVVKNDLLIHFVFRIEPDLKFKPKLIIKNINKARFKRIAKEHLDNLVFHLGLIEIPSYWKATCSPELVIKAGYLDKKQAEWWHSLFIKGLGQFYFGNKIDFRKKNLLTINVDSDRKYSFFDGRLQNRVLIPVGGGRDSIVTLQKNIESKKEVNSLLVNPSNSAINVVNIAGIKRPIVIQRLIDPLLIELNSKGYLNGHTPFTSLLSFVSVFCSVLFNYKNIAFSNEKSSNEGNVKYLGKTINHQWAKSSDFEKGFNIYCWKYLARDIKYFSFLRKYGEAQISRMFLKYPKYFKYFSSCNIGLKRNQKWCGNCPKCLFVYATLYPYFDRKDLLQIFGKDIFDNEKLLNTMMGLLGRGKIKPFECVGTYRESRQIFKLSLAKAKKKGDMPRLLRKFEHLT